MEGKIVNLNRKIKLIVFAKRNPAFGLRKFDEVHRIVESIVKYNIRKDIEIFEGISKESAYFSNILLGMLMNKLTFPFPSSAVNQQKNTVTQWAFTCSKLTIERLEKSVKYVQS